MKHLLLAAGLLACLALAACAGPAALPDAATAGTAAGGTPQATPETAVLYLDFTAGSEVEDVRPVELPAPVSADGLCAALTDETGIPFDFALAWDGGDWTVTWQDGSALWSGEMPQGGGPDYMFYDADLLRWFLLDTVWHTLTDGFGADTVTFRLPDGAAPDLAGLWPLEHFDLTGPYRGSAWYYAESIAFKDEWEMLEQTGQP